ncbi:glycosyltransferase [Salinibacterium sp. SYSU T00001]|uniref:glycosyltransferase n=1 Tax=Homoserinimonas sedimenticola TaxID=2986805 RepID=UPI0022361801|nr:glycosyltransferase [Salinibacterium sedimenticola]MCW4384758.1 glycosyltransferase [Salinibacterium sedimenticola]
MRILHVTEALGGGVQSAIVNYVRATPDLEHAVLSRGREGQSTHGWPAGVDAASYDGGLLGFYRTVERAVRRMRPDVVHLHSSFAGAARAFLPVGTHIVYSPHCFAFERTDISGAVRWGFSALEYVLAKRPQTTLSVSPYEGMLSRTLSRINPVVVAPNPSPLTPELATASSERPAPEPTVTMVGRLGSQKAPELFAEVAHLCQDDGMRFVWIGDGPAGVPEMLRASGATVTGWKQPDEVRDLLTRSSLYLHTASWEGGPVSAIEAASLGVPVISRTIPSMRSLGYATAGGSARELAQAVRRFSHDGAYRHHVEMRTAVVRRRCSRERLERSLREAYELATAR